MPIYSKLTVNHLLSVIVAIEKKLYVTFYFTAHNMLLLEPNFLSLMRRCFLIS